MTIKAPDGTGIKGGKVDYHMRRALMGIELLSELDNPLWVSTAEFTERVIYYHVRMAARAALNGMYNDKRLK